MDLIQLRNYIINPPLQSVSLWSESAEILLIGTCGIETNYGQYVHQIGGPALGVFQMEPATHLDIWKNYLKSDDIARDILDILGAEIPGYDRFMPDNYIPDPQLLIYNLYYATLMTRVFYLRIKEPLPAANDALGMATYYKKYYNTSMGKTDLSHAVAVFKDVIAKIGG